MRFKLWLVVGVLTLSLKHSEIYAGFFTKVEILKEETDSFTFEEATRLRSMFERYDTVETVREKKSYWLKFNYSKVDPEEINLLFSPYILFQKLDLYYYIKDSLYHHQSGVSLDFKSRHLYLPTLYLQLPNSTDEVECFLHVESFYGYTFMFLESPLHQLISNEIKEATGEYFLLGLSFLAAIISLIFYFSLKDKLYLYYGMFSIFLIMSRLTFSGYIFNYLAPYIHFTSLKSIYNLYSISYGGINLALLFYFYELLKRSNPFRYYKLIIYCLACTRLLFLLIHINVENPAIEVWVDSRIFDLLIQFYLLASMLIILKRTYKQEAFKQSIIAVCSILLIIVGNLLYVLHDWGLINIQNKETTYYLFLNFAGLEVILFASFIAFRNYYLRKEHDKAVSLVVENLKAREILKDELNKELERKVEERTEQIRLMNEVLKSHNIELATEVSIANKARVFQKAMNFDEFQKIFPNDEACYDYLSKLKCKSKENFSCRKCGYNSCVKLANHSLRCGKCLYTESVTFVTLFERLKFSILKAFYITYRTSIGKKDDTTLLEMAQEIDLRKATLWTFRQKVISLMDANTSRKKHKDGWTHLIEYSISVREEK